MRLLTYLKRGNLSSGLAALGNLVIAIAKFIVAGISGSGTMFATAMHSMADTVNQGFVYFGSVMAEKEPSERFPTGFGRVINLVCMVAVIVVTVMAYHTITNGWNLFINPERSTDFTLNLIVLVFSVGVDGYILYKTMKEIRRESRAVPGEEGLIKSAIRNVQKATPATKLVFYEDIVATLGAVLAIIGIVLAQFFGVLEADGIISILIGILMLFVAYRVGYDNMLGLIGVAAPAEVEDYIANEVLKDSCVVDIYEMRVIQEGRAYHVYMTVELKKGLSLDEADDLKFRMNDQLLADPNITDVVLAVIEDDEVRAWPKRNEER